MNHHRPMVAFGRYPCCNAMRPLAILDDARRPVYESCPSCGTRVTRVFNGFLHVIALREPSRQIRIGEQLPAFKAKRATVEPVSLGWGSAGFARDPDAIERRPRMAWASRHSNPHL
jgi:hypothetical protein